MKMRRRSTCDKVDADEFKQVIDDHLEVNKTCEVRYKNQLKGFMHKTDNGLYIGSIECCEVEELKRVCGSCKKLRRFLNRLAKKTPVSVMSTYDIGGFMNSQMSQHDLSNY